MDALGITITPLSPQRNHPISPTVPFPSNQYGEAGSRRDDIDEPQSFPIESGEGMLGEVYWVMLPPPASRWAGLLGKWARRGWGQNSLTQRRRKQVPSVPIIILRPLYLCKTCLEFYMSSGPRRGKNWLTCFNERKIKVAVAKWRPAIGHSKGQWALKKHQLWLKSYRSPVNT